MTDKPLVLTETRGPIFIVTINRIEARNAVDGATAAELLSAFRTFDADDSLKVAILTGADGTFCAGADLKAIGSPKANHIEHTGRADGPMGPRVCRLINRSLQPSLDTQLQEALNSPAGVTCALPIPLRSLACSVDAGVCHW